MPAPARNRKLRTLQLVTIIFLTVSGGPYGLEALLSYSREHAALLILLITPMLWDVPAIFTVLELNGMMPVVGGYYQWVKHALGQRWAFYEGWWTWLYSFADLAIYPVLFVEYAGYFFPGIQSLKIPICLIIIWLSAGVNITGIAPVGRVAIVLSSVVLMPLFLMFAWFGWNHTGGWFLPAPSIKELPYPSLAMAVYTVMWNCFGWDNITTYADEVEKPTRAYLISILSAFILVMAVYSGVVIVAQLSGINYQKFADEGMPLLAELIGGKWMGMIIAVGGMASMAGLYLANILSVSRLPKVMADDGLMPARLHNLHPRFGTPYLSIIVCSVVVSLMTFFNFGELLIIDVTVYGAGLFLEYIALIKMRIHEPDRHRPFRIPLNVRWLIGLFILPAGIYLLALTGILSAENDALKPALFAVGALCSAEVVWQVVKWRKTADQDI